MDISNSVYRFQISVINVFLTLYGCVNKALMVKLTLY